MARRTGVAAGEGAAGEHGQGASAEYLDGASVAKVAKSVGVSKGTVSLYLNEIEGQIKCKVVRRAGGRCRGGEGGRVGVAGRARERGQARERAGLPQPAGDVGHAGVDGRACRWSWCSG